MSTPIIASESPTRVIELSSEDQGDSEGNVTRFQVLPGIQEEILEFVKLKLLDSIAIQRFLVEREIEFDEKYIDFLTKQDDQGHYNNHNDLYERPRVEMSSEQRDRELGIRREHLKQLKSTLLKLGMQEENACDYLNLPIKQFNILNSPETNLPYKITNKEWIYSFNNSITLQKIKMIFEKLKGVEQVKMEVKFWCSEVSGLLEKLEAAHKDVAFGILIEMISFLSDSENRNLIHMANHLIEKEEMRDRVFKKLEVSNETLENYVANIKVFVALFLELTITDAIYRQRFSDSICQLMMKTLQNLDLTENHLISIVEIFEAHGQRLLVLEKFDKILGLIESKTEILSRHHQSRVTSLLTIQRTSSPLSVPLLAPRLTSARVSIRNLTVIEYPSQEAMQEHTVVSKEDLEKLEMEMERKLRIKWEEEMRVNQARLEQEKLEEQRRVEERNGREEEAKRLREQARLRLEEERRVQEQQRQALENERRLRQLQDQREAYKRNNPCTLFPGATFYKHTRPNETFDQSVFNGKIVGIYFSGHWCPPSRDFTPILQNFYSQTNEDFEVLFVSTDNNQQEMQKYMQEYHGDWFHLPLKCPLANQLCMNIKAIPALHILKPDHKIIDANGWQAVRTCTDPQALMNAWKAA